MAFTKIDFSDVESFEPLPEGEYDIEIDKVEVRMNKAGDGMYLNWELLVLDGEFENRRLWMITSLKPTALFRLKQVLEDLDVLEDDEVELEYDDDVDVTSSGGPRLLYPELEGIQAVAVVRNEMYEGKEKNRVEQLLGDEPTPKKTKAKAKAKRTKDSDNDTVARSRSRSRAKSRDDEEEEDDDDEEEEEAPRRSRRASTRSSRNTGRRKLR